MANWRQLGSIWQLRPAEPAGLVEFIGGSYLAATPQISYRRLLEELAADGLAVHAWSYVCLGSIINVRPAMPGALSAQRVANLRSAAAPSLLRCGLATAWDASFTCWPLMVVGAAGLWWP